MAKEKTTITVDRAKVKAALELTGAKSTSEVIDVACRAVAEATSCPS